MAKQSIKSACINMAARHDTSFYSPTGQQIVDSTSRNVDIDSAMDEAMEVFAATADEEPISRVLNICRKRKPRFNASFSTLEPMYLKASKSYFSMSLKIQNGTLKYIIVRFDADGNRNSVILRLQKLDKKFQLEFPKLPGNFDYAYITGIISLANEFAFVNKT